MLAVRFSKDIEDRLSKLSKLTNRPKSFYVKAALDKYLEDMEDIYIALERMADPNRVLLTSEQVLKELTK